MGPFVRDLLEYEEGAIRFRTCSIWNGWNDVLESMIRGMGQVNMDVGVFQKTKLTDGIYTRGLASYRVVATLAMS